MSAPLRVESVGATHVGLKRKNNEDSYCLRPQHCLWAVADGMGGHENGEWASARITEALDRLVIPDGFDDACTAIADAVHQANATLFAESQSRGVRMGSTVVVLYLNGARFALFWVGDSRGYVLRDGTLHQLTRDHSQVQAMVDKGLITPEEAVGHPMSHVLARAVGVQPGLEIDVIADDAEPGDIFLLCSDGLTARLSDPELAAMLGERADAGTLDRLIAATLDRGAPDNVTTVLVGVTEATALTLNGPGELAR
jgi:serine/threonine protein phosphatase PrpC